MRQFDRMLEQLRPDLVIGYGGRIRGVISTMRNLGEPLAVAAIADPRADELRGELGAEAPSPKSQMA